MIEHHELITYSLCSELLSLYIFGKITNKIKQIERFGEPQKNLPGVKKSNHAWLSILEPIKVSSRKLHMVNAYTSSNVKKTLGYGIYSHDSKIPSNLLVFYIIKASFYQIFIS